jgi:Arc/MetJ-type ribon-helix-helix transcriptional regulator
LKGAIVTMSKAKDRPRYQSVSLSVPFVKEIKDYIADKEQYRSVADFVRQSASRQIELGQFKKELNDKRTSYVQVKHSSLKGAGFEEQLIVSIHIMEWFKKLEKRLIEIEKKLK